MNPEEITSIKARRSTVALLHAINRRAEFPNLDELLARLALIGQKHPELLREGRPV